MRPIAKVATPIAKVATPKTPGEIEDIDIQTPRLKGTITLQNRSLGIP